MRPAQILLLLAVLSLPALAGCMDETTDPDGTGPDTSAARFPGDCDREDIEVGDNARMVGGVWDGAGSILADVDVVAVATDGDDRIDEFTNDDGCYYLSFDVGLTYDVTFSRSGYTTRTFTGITASPGLDRVQDVSMPPV